MSTTGAGEPRNEHPVGAADPWRSAALLPALFGLCVVGALTGLATTAHAAGFNPSSAPLGGGVSAVQRCAPSSGLSVTPVLEAAAGDVAYSVTAITVSGLSGCAGRSVEVAVQRTGTPAVVQLAGVVPAGGGPLVIDLPEDLDPLAWLGWSATVGT